MDDEVRTAMKYLSTPAGSFWKWVDEGRVVAWKHGATVAFREEVGAVLERLLVRGLPPFDSVLVLLAATRHYWPEDSVAWRNQLQVIDLAAQQIQRQMPHLVAGKQTVFEVLDRIHKLPIDLIQSVDAKAALAEIVFEAIPPTLTGNAARYACEILTHGLVREQNVIPFLPNLRGGRVQTTLSMTSELLSLKHGLSQVTEQSLRLRLKTGLDELPLPADTIVPAEPAAVRALLQTLALDEDLSGLSRVARSLSAVLLLPRPITASDELPLGGVSDISNRGTLDRLLLSELAHEDLMLATRVALNEALYLRRETPPGPPPQRRYVLIDSGIRMWGVPRVFAAATVLSLAATAPAGGSLVAYRATGTGIELNDLSSRDGLVRHLEMLEPDLHPGASLAEFFQKIAEEDLPAEIIIVTSDTTASDAEFQRALADAAAPSCYLAAVNREGELQLLSRGERGTKSLMSLTLDLDTLLKPKSPHQVRLVDKGIDPNLPAIFHTSRFPFRLPCALASNQKTGPIWSVRLPASVGSHPRGVMILMRDRRLMFYDEFQRGAVQVATDVPFGPCLWSASFADVNLNYALIHRSAEPAFHLLVLNTALRHLVATRKLASQFLAHSGPGSRVLGATCRHGVVYVIYQSKVEAFELSSGQFLQCRDYDSHLKWNRGLFFEDSLADAYDEWRLLTSNGTHLQFEPIVLHGPERTGALLALFERVGRGGPFGVHLRGSIANLADHTEWRWTDNSRANPKVLDIEESGHRLLIEQESDGSINRRGRRIVHLESEAVEDVGPYIQSLREWDLQQMHRGGNVMHRFSRIRIEHDGTMTLVSKSQTGWQIGLHSKTLRISQISRITDASGRRCVASLEPTRHPDSGCSMSVATWPDGSRAFIDSRGLLHLQSADREIPEATLTLKEGDIAAWTNNGQTYGSHYFLDESNMSAEQFLDQILKPFIARLT
ncbi:MAG: hypothetical protein JWP89_1665 [Schlesneria sp.]|nr:hypothetical protein [Schlesneria sp.]